MGTWGWAPASREPSGPAVPVRLLKVASHWDASIREALPSHRDPAGLLCSGVELCAMAARLVEVPECQGGKLSHEARILFDPQQLLGTLAYPSSCWGVRDVQASAAAVLASSRVLGVRPAV